MDLVQPKPPKTAILLPMAGLAAGGAGGFYLGKMRASDDAKQKVLDALNRVVLSQYNTLADSMTPFTEPQNINNQWMAFLSDFIQAMRKDEDYSQINLLNPPSFSPYQA